MNRKRGTRFRGRYTGVSSDFAGILAGRKGQVTVFIIIGIVILFTFAGILLITRGTVTSSLSSQGEPIIAAAPREFQPIQTFTENCLSQVSERGLRALGQHAGYINPEILGEFSVSNPTESDGINLEPSVVPYWHYNVQPNDANVVSFSSLKPKLVDDGKDGSEFSIQAQVERFVLENIDECLDEYSVFDNLGFEIIMDEDTDVKVSIGDGIVGVLLERDVDVKKGALDASLDRFYVRLPLNLKHYYEIAGRIMDAQREFSFLERQGMELISVYSSLSPEDFPPTSDVTYDFISTLSWSEFALKEKFKEVLTSYVPMLRYLGSGNFHYSAFSNGQLLAQKVIDNMVLPLDGANDLDISFDYFGWEPYFKTNSEGGKIQPEHLFVSYGVLNFGTQRYETHYDASYPVLVTIKDSAALGGDGYQFTFALESNIRNNDAAIPNVVKQVYPRKVSSLACDEEQRSTEPIRSVVVDSFTKEPLELVKIGLTIPEQGECEIGLTDTRGKLESKYPAVYGGVMSFIKEDYLVNQYPIDTYKYQDSKAIIGWAVDGLDEEVVEMHRIKSINVSIKKKNFDKCITPVVCQYTLGGLVVPVIPAYKDISCKEKGKQQCFGGDNVFGGEPLIEIKADNSLSYLNQYYLGGEEQLSDDESAMIVLERVSDLHDEVVNSDFTASVNIKGEQKQEVRLVPGIYKVSGTLYSDKDIHIPEDGRCMSFSILGFDTENCFTIDATALESYLKGSFMWNSSATYLTITPEDLYSANELELLIPAQNIGELPRTIKGLSKECGGFLCIPAVGCAFEACAEKDIQINSLVVEDLRVVSEIDHSSRLPQVRAALAPRFK